LGMKCVWMSIRPGNPSRCHQPGTSESSTR
jgi:hypothetical protein